MSAFYVAQVCLGTRLPCLRLLRSWTPPCIKLLRDSAIGPIEVKYRVLKAFAKTFYFHRLNEITATDLHHFWLVLAMEATGKKQSKPGYASRYRTLMHANLNSRTSKGRLHNSKKTCTFHNTHRGFVHLRKPFASYHFS